MIVKEQSFGKCVVRLTEVNGNYRAQLTTTGSGAPAAADSAKARQLYALWVQEARSLEESWRQKQNQLNASRIAAPPKKQTPALVKTNNVAVPKVAPVPVVTAAQLQKSVEPLKAELRDLRKQMGELEASRKEFGTTTANLQGEINRLNKRMDDLLEVLFSRPSN